MSFVKKCEQYIGNLKSQGKLIAAQPVLREGWVLFRSADDWQQEVLDSTKEVQLGYCHILADSISEAIEIAKQNPEFEYVPSAKIEIHQIKTKEEKTNFVYPK